MQLKFDEDVVIKLKRTVDGETYSGRIRIDTSGEEPIFKASVHPDLKPGQHSAAAISNDDMVRLFPEVEPVVRIAGSAIDGVPRYAASEGLKYLGYRSNQPLPKDITTRPEAQDLGEFAQHWRISLEQAEEIAVRFQKVFADGLARTFEEIPMMRRGVSDDLDETKEQQVLRNPDRAGWIRGRVGPHLQEAIEQEIDRLRPQWSEEARKALEVFGIEPEAELSPRSMQM